MTAGVAGLLRKTIKPAVLDTDTGYKYLQLVKLLSILIPCVEHSVSNANFNS